MREIFIKYNPYRLETSITIDGAAPKQNSRLNFGDRRLQEWIEELPEILFEECSSRDFKITFHGTILDYEDVESMAREAKKNGLNIELEHIPAKEVSDKEAAIDEIFDEIQAGPFDELKQPDVVKAFNMAKSSDFEVNVVATMSAGKSTLINALLRQKLMPAKQEACTATITEIKDNDADHFMAKVYDTNGNLIQTHPELSFEIMDSLNSNPEVSKIHVEGNIPFVTSEDVSLVLVDTPGPNNSRDPEHKAATYRMLSESSKTVVLYILNATQLAVNDDYNLLSHVADSMKVGGKQSRDRFIFVVNKLDDFKKGEDSIEAAITKVRDYLRDNGIENANIYPASALTALNIRTILAESDDDDDDEVYEAKGKVRKFIRNPEMYFETLAPLTPSVRGEIETRLANARSNHDTYEEALIHCGIVPIEMAIKMYVQKYAKTAKIKNIVDTFSKRLESAKSFETTKQEITENQDKQKEILANIEVIKKKLASGEDAKRFKSRIEQINYDSEIRKMANDVIMVAQKKITEQLSSSDTKISKREAEELCRQFARFADNLQAEVQVKLEELIGNHVHKSATDLLEEYRKKISELAQDVNIGTVSIDPFELMAGDISTDVSSLINNLTETERVKVDEVWVENTSKKWYKPWTWFQEKGHWKDIYEDKEYVDGTKLAQRFFAPIQEQLYENSNNAIEYAKAQTKKIKQDFSKKFVELDTVLKKKLQELEDCANDNKNVERRIRESQAKLKWLEEIQIKTKAILDI
ncbi:dynamin family protein [Enterocloster clostridioformis]|uniref:dynamin family protein n=1 Tax=Enterocloster clostridioformis TaxID=1531 RepID=UPI001F400D03|nr:dynamin family protein [Enterocloster clostridioformis]MCF2703129.1 dynamin family protein [Enterocloster clostridioformis]